MYDLLNITKFLLTEFTKEINDYIDVLNIEYTEIENEYWDKVRSLLNDKKISELSDIVIIEACYSQLKELIHKYYKEIPIDNITYNSYELTFKILNNKNIKTPLYQIEDFNLFYFNNYITNEQTNIIINKILRNKPVVSVDYIISSYLSTMTIMKKDKDSIIYEVLKKLEDNYG